jgi:hypothetical protein
VDLKTGQRQRTLPGFIMGGYSLSRDAAKVVFTTLGHEKGDGIWIADLERRSPPRQLTRGGEPRAFFGAPGEIVYMGEGNRLYRMKEDGSQVELISQNPIVYLLTVSPEARWAMAIMPQSSPGAGTSVEFVSLRGEKSVPACDSCGLGPRSVLEVLPFNWSADGKSLFVNLVLFGKRTRRTIVLPYRSDVPLETLWPARLETEEGIAANPGARMINAAYTFPGSEPSMYLSFRTSFHSNLYRLRLPN